jgi:hypothetical protein
MWMEMQQGVERRRTQEDRRRAQVDMRQVAVARRIVEVTLRRRALEEQASAQPEEAETSAELLGVLAREWLTLNAQFRSLERQQQEIRERRVSERRSGPRSD